MYKQVFPLLIERIIVFEKFMCKVGRKCETKMLKIIVYVYLYKASSY